MIRTFLKSMLFLLFFCLVTSPVTHVKADISNSQEGNVIYHIHYDYDAIFKLLKMERGEYDEYWDSGFSIAEMAEKKGVSKHDLEEYFVSYHRREMQKWRDKGLLSEFDYFDLVYRLKEDIEEFINRNPNK